jgi:hypothetical protein
MQQNFQDAMAIVEKLEKPDLLSSLPAIRNGLK